MLVYYIIFIVSSILVYLADKKMRGLRGKKICWLLAVLIPSLLAGLRAESVGTDTSGYIKAIHHLCVNDVDWKVVVGAYQCEIGYYFVNFLVTRISDSFQLLLFVLQILILAPVLLACKDNADLVEPYLSYFLFLILFYNRSLNMCRQSIAIAICIYSVQYVRSEKIVKFLVCLMLAISIHKIAFIFLTIYIISHFLQKKEGVYYKLSFLAAVCCLIIFYKVILNKLISMGYLGSRYLYYVNSGNQNISTIELTTKILYLILILCVASILKKKNRYNEILIFFLVLDFLIYCIGFYANYAQRISYYIGIFTIFVVPQIANCVNKRQKYICLFVLLFIAFAFSYKYYGISGCDGTVPYILSTSM